MTRRHLLCAAGTAAAALAAQGGRAGSARGPQVMTVEGPIDASRLGVTLPHEHVMCDFGGAAVTGRHRWNGEEVAARMRPYLERLKAAGCRTFVDCTPASIGRDPRVLRRLAADTGLHFITNTGHYGAAGNRYLPDDVRAATVDALAARWVREWRDGIEETGVRPGFIKVGVDGPPLSAQHARLVRAAARAHKATGLTIACHTGGANPAEVDRCAREQMAILADEGVDPSAWVWVHAQGGTREGHAAVARAGGWVELDGYGPGGQDAYVGHVLALKSAGGLGRLLLSQDAGWYTVGEPNGGTPREFTSLLVELLPALRKAGVTDSEVRQLTARNPAQAFAVRRRLLD